MFPLNTFSFIFYDNLDSRFAIPIAVLTNYSVLLFGVLLGGYHISLLFVRESET